MGISYDEAVELIERLEWMRGYPCQSESGKVALSQALVECSRDRQHAEEILRDAQQGFNFCPTPRELLEISLQHLPEPVAFHPRKRYLDEKPWYGDGMYGIWTDRDVAMHTQLLDAVYRTGKAKGQPNKFARQYAKQALAGWADYCAQKPDSWDVPRWNTQMQPLMHVERYDVRCHVCMDTTWQYVEATKAAIGTVRRCICQRMLGVQTDAA